MEDVKVFCVNCLNLVDPKTHRNCTLTFDNLVDAEERGDAGNFRQNGEVVAEEGSEIINLSTCQGRNESNHLMNKHPAFQKPETSIQHQPTEMSSDSDSSSPSILEDENPVLQTSRHPDYANNNSNFYGVNRVFYEPSSQSYNTIHPVYPHFLIGQKFGQVTPNIQQENEFQNAMPQNNERNIFHQEYPQSSYVQNFTKNTIPPPNFHSFYSSFPTSVQNEGMNTFGQMGYQPYFNYLQQQKQYLPCEPVVNDKVNYSQHQNQYVPYEPPVNNKASPNHNMSVENYSDSIKTSPISPAQTVIPKAYKLSVNRDRELYADNRVPSPNLVSETELTKESIVELDTAQNCPLKNNHQSTPQKSACSTQKNKKSLHQKTEKNITPQVNVKESTRQENKEQSVHQKNEVKNSSHGHSDEMNLVSKTELTRESIVELDTAQNRLLTNNPQSTPQKSDDKTQKNKKNEHQKNKKSPHQKTEKKITPQENVKGSTPQKNKEQSVHQKNEVGNSSQGHSDETNIVSKTELTRENIVELDTEQNGLLTNNAQSTPQKSADSTQKNKKNAHRKNRKSPHQKTEKKITSQDNVEESTSQKNKEQSVHQKNEVRNSSQGNLDENVLQKIAEKQVKGKNVEKGVSAKNAEKGTHAEDSEENVHIGHAEKDAHARNPEQNVHAKKPEQRVNAKDAEHGVNVKGVKCEQGVNAKGVKSEQEAHGKDEKNAGRFTGEGYKSIEEFIEALYNGTLYKRY